MTVTASRYTIEQVDVPSLGEDDGRALARLRQTLDHERLPDDPVAPLHVVERRLRNRPPANEWSDWIARDDHGIVACANAIQWKTISNPHWRDSWIGVHPDHRRRGLGTQLLRRIADAYAHDDAAVFASYTSSLTGSAPFAERAGMTAGLETRTSELRLADIDRDLVARWARIDPPGYRLVWIDGDTPDELIDNVVVAYDAMNTAPHGTLSYGEERITAEQLREWEALRRTNGGEHRLLLAIEAATGATAGYTEIGRHPETPWTIGQNGTAVIPEHRGRGIGKWLKARMIERIFEEWGDARAIRTGNAYVNAPMLAINDRLGFTVTQSVTVWEGGIAGIRRYLEGRA